MAYGMITEKNRYKAHFFADSSKSVQFKLGFMNKSTARTQLVV